MSKLPIIGTPLGTKNTSSVPVWKHTANDKERKRFHDEFSASYFTAEYKEEWTLSSFHSSRTGRCDKKQRSIESYMDDKDKEIINQQRILILKPSIPTHRKNLDFYYNSENVELDIIGELINESFMNPLSLKYKSKHHKECNEFEIGILKDDEDISVYEKDHESIELGKLSSISFKSQMKSLEFKLESRNTCINSISSHNISEVVVPDDFVPRHLSSWKSFLSKQSNTKRKEQEQSSSIMTTKFIPASDTQPLTITDIVDIGDMKVTRSIWIPNSLLCKRFNVKALNIQMESISSITKHSELPERNVQLFMNSRPDQSLFNSIFMTNDEHPPVVLMDKRKVFINKSFSKKPKNDTKTHPGILSFNIEE